MFEGCDRTVPFGRDPDVKTCLGRASVSRTPPSPDVTVCIASWGGRDRVSSTAERGERCLERRQSHDQMFEGCDLTVPRKALRGVIP